MSDITTTWQGTYGDWSLGDNADLTQGDDLITAVIISVMSDRVLPDGVDAPDGSGDPRGWWADDPAHPVGSRIWTLLRAKQTDQTLKDAHDFLVEGTQWLIDDGVVASFDITTEWDGAGFLAATVTANRPAATPVSIRFSWAWDDVFNG